MWYFIVFLFKFICVIDVVMMVFLVVLIVINIFFFLFSIIVGIVEDCGFLFGLMKLIGDGGSLNLFVMCGVLKLFILLL